MSSENVVERTKKYTALKTYLLIGGTILNIALLVIFQVFFSEYISIKAGSLSVNFYLSCLAYVLVFSVFMYVGSFPLHFYSSYYAERIFDLSEQKFLSWVKDEVKSGVLSLLVTFLGVGFFYLFIRNFPGYWWVITGLSWVFFSIIVARVFPVLILPLFYKYAPIEDRSLKDKLVSMGERAAINIIEISKIDLSRKTKKANAALIGSGRSRKIILADTLMDEFDEDEIVTVVAHEMAHHKFKHIPQLIIFSGIVTLVGFYWFSEVAGTVVNIFQAANLYDLKIFPVFMFLLMLFSLLVMPIQNWFSRVLEKQADAEALLLTGKPAVFISVMEKLASMNLSEIDPHPVKKFFLYNHPPISERIKMAEEWGR